MWSSSAQSSVSTKAIKLLRYRRHGTANPSSSSHKKEIQITLPSFPSPRVARTRCSRRMCSPRSRTLITPSSHWRNSLLPSTVHNIICSRFLDHHTNDFPICFAHTDSAETANAGRISHSFCNASSNSSIRASCRRILSSVLRKISLEINGTHLSSLSHHDFWPILLIEWDIINPLFVIKELI